MTHLESLTKKLHALLPELAKAITLEHVLRALGIIGHYYTLNPSSEEGCWIEVDENATIWDLNHPLHKQSPELHEFLDSLLPEPNEE